MNSITELLDLEDIDISITDIRIEGRKKFLSLETKLEAHFCPCCGFKMYSRGIKRRKISHPVLQDGYELILVLKQRRWRCTNPDCGYVTNDTFRFVGHRRRTTNASDMLIVLAFRNLDDSAVSIARRFKTSDTHVLEVFDKYVKLDRLPLPTSSLSMRSIPIWKKTASMLSCSRISIPVIPSICCAAGKRMSLSLTLLPSPWRKERGSDTFFQICTTPISHL